jgi:hypothetical protein
MIIHLLAVLFNVGSIAVGLFLDQFGFLVPLVKLVVSAIVHPFRQLLASQFMLYIFSTLTGGFLAITGSIVASILSPRIANRLQRENEKNELRFEVLHEALMLTKKFNNIFPYISKDDDSETIVSNFVAKRPLKKELKSLRHSLMTFDETFNYTAPLFKGTNIGSTLYNFSLSCREALMLCIKDTQDIDATTIKNVQSGISSNRTEISLCIQNYI